MNKTHREIELEKRIKELEEGSASIARGQELVDEIGDYEAIIEHIKKLEKKLDIAIKALEKIVDDKECSSCLECQASFYAELALAEIEEKH